MKYTGVMLLLNLQVEGGEQQRSKESKESKRQDNFRSW